MARRLSLERDVERLIRQALELRGYIVIKTDAGAHARWAKSVMGHAIRGDMPAGFPDLVVCHPQRPAFFVEVKRKGGKLSKHQLRYQAMLRELGYKVYTVFGEDGLAELMEEI